MNEAVTNLPIKKERRSPERLSAQRVWAPFENLHREIERVFDDFNGGLWGLPFRRTQGDSEPLWPSEMRWNASPAVDISEDMAAYKITAELPGMDEKDIEVTLSNGNLIISGEKQIDKEEKETDYYLNERCFGSFERRFAMPEGVDASKVEAKFNKGVLTVTLPKTAEAQKPERKIEVKAAA